MVFSPPECTEHLVFALAPVVHSLSLSPYRFRARRTSIRIVHATDIRGAEQETRGEKKRKVSPTLRPHSRDVREMPDTNTRSRKRDQKEVEPATPSASASNKTRKRTPGKQKAVSEATPRNKANCAKKATKAKKSRGLSHDRKDLIARVVEKSRSENSGPSSAESRPATTRNLRDGWRSYSVPSDTSFPKKLSVAKEQWVEPKKSTGGPGRHRSLRHERVQEAVPDSHRGFIGAFQLGRARQKHDRGTNGGCKGSRRPKITRMHSAGEIIARRIEEANNRDIYEWYKNQDEEYEEEHDRKRNKF